MRQDTCTTKIVCQQASQMHTIDRGGRAKHACLTHSFLHEHADPFTRTCTRACTLIPTLTYTCVRAHIHTSCMCIRTHIHVPRTLPTSESSNECPTHERSGHRGGRSPAVGVLLAAAFGWRTRAASQLCSGTVDDPQSQPPPMRDRPPPPLCPRCRTDLR
jgi:hypothetical protein